MSSNHKLPGAMADKHDQPYFAYEEDGRCVIKLNGENKNGVMRFEGKGGPLTVFGTKDPIIPEVMYGVVFSICFEYANGKCGHCDWDCKETHLRGVIAQVWSDDRCSLHLFDGTIRH